MAVINSSYSRVYDKTDRFHRNRHCQDSSDISDTKVRWWLSSEYKFGVYICTGMLHSIAVWILGQISLSVVLFSPANHCHCSPYLITVIISGWYNRSSLEYSSLSHFIYHHFYAEQEEVFLPRIWPLSMSSSQLYVYWVKLWRRNGTHIYKIEFTYIIKRKNKQDAVGVLGLNPAQDTNCNWFFLWFPSNQMLGWLGPTLPSKSV
jgi:hypothetical protein